LNYFNIASEINKISLTPPVERNDDTFELGNQRATTMRQDQKTPLFMERDQCIIIDSENKLFAQGRQASCPSLRYSKQSISSTSRLTNSKSKSKIYNRKFVMPLRGALYEMAPVEFTPSPNTANTTKANYIG
jgi:hypothetical protein